MTSGCRVTYTQAVEGSPNTATSSSAGELGLVSRQTRALTEKLYQKRVCDRLSPRRSRRSIYFRTMTARRWPPWICSCRHQRDHRAAARGQLDLLLARMKELSLGEEDYWVVPRSAIGYGGPRGLRPRFLERMIMYVTGIPNIRDSCPSPPTGTAEF